MRSKLLLLASAVLFTGFLFSEAISLIDFEPDGVDI